MANLYKKPVTITDPKTRKQVKGKSKKWWGAIATNTASTAGFR